jgi:hypothetical protein
MAGYFIQDEFSGETVNLPYAHPFVVRAENKSRGAWDRPEVETVSSFRTESEARAWLAKWEAEYKKGPNGHARLWVENWNK